MKTFTYEEIVEDNKDFKFFRPHALGHILEGQWKVAGYLEGRHHYILEPA